MVTLHEFFPQIFLTEVPESFCLFSGTELDLEICANVFSFVFIELINSELAGSKKHSRAHKTALCE